MTDESTTDDGTDTPETDALLVASTADGAGKTAVALALALLARERGDSVGYLKPKGTRLESNVGKTLDADPMLARELLGLDAETHELEPIVYSPTFVDGAISGREDTAALREQVRDCFDRIAADAETVFIEGGDIPSTGGIVDLDDSDVAELLDAQVLLIAGYEAGSDLDDVLAAANAFGDRLAGVMFNAVADGVADEVGTDAASFLERRGIPVLGVLPRRRSLAGVTVDELATELGANALTDAPTHGHVERFLVGAMGGDAALRYFRRTRDAAVVTGGDRSDVQTAAIEAPGVGALVVTGGHHPSGAVLGRAEEAGLPVLSVPGDTLSTVERAESVIRDGRTRDERTVETVRGLLRDHADVDGLLGK